MTRPWTISSGEDGKSIGFSSSDNADGRSCHRGREGRASVATAYAIEADPRLPSQKQKPRGRRALRFCELYGEWRKRLSPTMRQTHVAGDKLFVDWAGDTVPIIDPMTGEVHEAHLFVAALGASERIGRPVIRSSIDSFHNPSEFRYRRGRTSPEGFYLDSYDYAALRMHLLDPLGPGGSGIFALRCSTMSRILYWLRRRMSPYPVLS